MTNTKRHVKLPTEDEKRYPNFTRVAASGLWGDVMTPYTSADYQGQFNLLSAHRELLVRALVRYDGCLIKAAQSLGVTPRTIRNMKKQHQVEL